MNKVGDVLIAMYGATIGKVAIAGNEMTSNQACCACTPLGVFNYYLFYYLMGSQTDFIKKGESPMDAINKSSGSYGRIKDAVKLIDPRQE